MNTPAYMRWLPPSTIEALGRLEFIARGAVDGFIAGRHRSARKGASSEFAEHRAYSPGDDLRKLDWKLIARRQRLYMREYVDETNLNAAIVLDASGSMAYGGEAAVEGLSKFDYARRFAAALAYLLVRQQDAVGFYAYDTAVTASLPARSAESQIRLLLEQLDGVRPGGDTAAATVIHELAERVHRRSVVFLIGDFFVDSAEFVRSLHHLRYRRHEVVALQTVAREEIDFPFSRMTRFEDMESAASIDVDARALRREYRERYQAHQQALHRACGELDIVHRLLPTDVPVERALTGWLLDYRASGGCR